MKTALIISLLCLTTISSYAQLKQYKYTTNNHPKLKKGQRVPLTPAFSQPYTVVSQPACYMNKRRSGLEVMECPGILFAVAPSYGIVMNAPRSSGTIVTTDNVNTSTERTYISNSYGRSVINVDIPANAVPVYPSTPYIQLTNPPCYKYTTPKGLLVMECNGAIFPPQQGD